ncbi:MAG: DUF5684 domain-containing protein [Candidatus Delongbacteria bacterium]|jgi:hypothetical protein|nr:DUF5684 domain-containing protein [Candidatus Delongbacteria bacterium]
MDSNVFSLLVGAGAAILVIYFIIVVLMIVSYWIMFEKAKQPGWAAIIPIYNLIILLRTASLHWAWVFLIFAGIIPIVGFLAVWVFFGIIVSIRVAKNFGQTGGFAVGLILLPFIFYPILAFNKKIQWTGVLNKKDVEVGGEYKEKKEEKPAEETKEEETKE